MMSPVDEDASDDDALLFAFNVVVLQSQTKVTRYTQTHAQAIKKTDIIFDNTTVKSFDNGVGLLDVGALLLVF
jgi:hypothetical protein